MATFKAGTRVKCVRVPHDWNDAIALFPRHLIIGRTATVLSGGGTDIAVAWDTVPRGFEMFKKFAIEPAYCFEPLTDPGYDAFMQSVLKPVNLDQPEKVRV